MSGARTFKVRTEGGAEFDVDYPPSSAPHREVLEDQVDRGTLVVVGVYDADGVLEECDTLTGPAGVGVADEGGFPVPPEGDPDPAAGAETVAPPVGASKQAWHDYALSVGADPADLVDLTKAELIEKYTPKEG